MSIINFKNHGQSMQYILGTRKRQNLWDFAIQKDKDFNVKITGKNKNKTIEEKL